MDILKPIAVSLLLVIGLLVIGGLILVSQQDSQAATGSTPPEPYPFPTTDIQTDLIMACRITVSATAQVAGSYQYKLQDYDAVVAAVFNELRTIRANNEQ